MTDIIELDKKDTLSGFRSKFYIPTVQGQQVTYLCGNSLGLKPINAEEAVYEVLDSWKKRGVLGHMQGEYPWKPYHEFLTHSVARLAGAHYKEVVVMNTLTVNLHLMLATFYRPVGKKRKILLEYHPFSSDRYAAESQIQWHGGDPDKDLRILSPSNDTGYVTKEDISQFFEKEGDEIALALIGSVNYYTGQHYDLRFMKELTEKYDCVLGLDLAHAIGNIDLSLHELSPDFAVWCHYKYVNGGPGCIAGCFVPERHYKNHELLRLAGWWGHDKNTRFEMPGAFVPEKSADGWQLSNPPILSMAALRASLKWFDEAGMSAIRRKNKEQTNYLLEWLEPLKKKGKLKVFTPKNPEERGGQISLYFPGSAKKLHQKLMKKNIITDYRHPGIIRLATAPLYNSYQDLYRFYEVLEEIL